MRNAIRLIPIIFLAILFLPLRANGSERLPDVVIQDQTDVVKFRVNVNKRLKC